MDKKNRWVNVPQATLPIRPTCDPPNADCPCSNYHGPGPARITLRILLWG